VEKDVVVQWGVPQEEKASDPPNENLVSEESKHEEVVDMDVAIVFEENPIRSSESE